MLNADTASLASVWGLLPTLKGLAMTPQFLRYEAARFRGMAGVAERESSKLRLLAMATDYDARAKIADDMTKPMPEEADTEGPKPEVGGSHQRVDSA